MINIPKGTKDVLPQESYKWHHAEQVAREITLSCGFREIRTPVFEHTELFLRSIGEGTDVVGKEMYTFLDKGNRSITLKPEGTAPVARSYVENNLESESLPLKMYYFTPVFRYERPQAGRLREHHQFGVEVYGGDTPYLDFEVIYLAHWYLSAMGVEDLALKVNSIGCPECRQKYHAVLKEFLSPKLDKLCPTCRERFDKNPLRIIDCKVESCKALIADAPKMYDHICEPCKTHMDGLLKLLDNSGIAYSIDKDIVRGLDYYTKTVFEFVTTRLGAQGTVCGGGRYNNLVESVGGKPTPCVGFGLGLERLLMLLDTLGVVIPDRLYPDVFVASQSADFIDDATALLYSLRKHFPADMDFTGRSFKAQLKYADKRKAKYVVIIGEREKAEGFYTVKCMNNGSSDEVKCNELSDYLEDKLLEDMREEGYTVATMTK